MWDPTNGEHSCSDIGGFGCKACDEEITPPLPKVTISSAADPTVVDLSFTTKTLTEALAEAAASARKYAWEKFDEPGPGYHLQKIAKGDLGEVSKIREELCELEDAMQQGVKIMALIELADMMGAVEAFLAKHFPGITMEDLSKMSTVTKRAFINGHRK